MNKKSSLPRASLPSIRYMDRSPTQKTKLAIARLSLLTFLLLNQHAFGAIFKCTDANGKQTYSDRPCRTQGNQQTDYNRYSENNIETSTQSHTVKTQPTEQDASVAPQAANSQQPSLAKSPINKPTIPTTPALVTHAKKKVSPTARIEDLIEAIKQDNTAEAKKLLLETPSLVNKLDDNGKSALHLSVKRTNYELVNFLLEHGAKANLENSYGETPVFTLAKIGVKHRQDIYESTQAITNLLDKHGADFRAHGRDGKSLLKHAVFYGNAYVAKIALQKGANVNERSKNGSTPMHEAAWTGNINILQLLINFRGNINALDKSGKTPIFGAAWTNKIDVAKFLLKHGAKLPTTGYTPLHLAAQHGNVEVADFFINAGVPINADDKGSTPLHVAAWTGQNAYIEWAFDKGAKVNAQNEFGETPLHVAAKWGKAETVEILLSLGANKNLPDSHGQLPKDVASLKSDSDVLAALQ